MNSDPSADRLASVLASWNVFWTVACNISCRIRSNVQYYATVGRIDKLDSHTDVCSKDAGNEDVDCRSVPQCQAKP